MPKNTLQILREWALVRIRHKDILKREITSIEQDKQGWQLIVREKTEDKYYLIAKKADFIAAAKKGEGKKVFVVVPSTKENLEALFSCWKELLSFPNFCITFANPYSLSETSWSVCPVVHERITEKAVLRKGLKAMFSTVERYKEIKA